MLQQVFAGFSYTEGATGAARETLSRCKKTRYEKRARLHRDWHEQVYEKINNRVRNAVDARSVQEIDDRLRHNFQA
jgi:hypothetical protein